MNIPHVFVRESATVSDLGFPVTVVRGQHWPAGDPLVQARPDLFTTDCRVGLQFSGAPPEYMTPEYVRLHPLEDDDPDVPRRGPGRPRTRVTA